LTTKTTSTLISTTVNFLFRLVSDKINTPSSNNVNSRRILNNPVNMVFLPDPDNKRHSRDSMEDFRPALVGPIRNKVDTPLARK
jgi:hypothetical protein